MLSFLVVGAFDQKTFHFLFDRLFPHALGGLPANLTFNLLILKFNLP